MTKGTELVPVSDYAVAQLDSGALQEMAAQMGPDLTEFDLQRFKVPSGGGVHWTMETLEGVDAVPHIDGVVILWKTVRAYWKIDYDESGGGTPPDCQSDDGFTGFGDPGGDCANCPLSKFGSADADKDGTPARGQACKQMIVIFLVTPNGILPKVIAAPPTSIKAVRSYMLKLIDNGLAATRVITRFTLEEDKNAKGIKYAKIIPSFQRKLEDDEAARIKAYADQVTPGLRKIVLDQQDFQEANQAGGEEDSEAA